jgi:hypothetical protein
MCVWIYTNVDSVKMHMKQCGVVKIDVTGIRIESYVVKS